MSNESYGQFCPVAMACELLSTRWTFLVIYELLHGSTRFNEIRRGVPRMSPTLLSKRLKELEEAKLIERVENGTTEYHLTDSGRDLAPIIEGMGHWATRWIDSECTLANLDAQLLMWNMRRKIDPDPLPRRRLVIEFIYPELPRERSRYWLIVSPGEGADLCSVDPGFDVDLYVSADLKAMTSAWMGMSRIEDEIDDGKIRLTGDRRMIETLSQWMKRSRYATV
jgi:DNA-binding HxlR family transcriptional regulator